MKALVYTKYGPPDVLRFKEVERPIPKANEVLVKVYATTVNRTDNATIKAIPWFARFWTGIFKPEKETPGTEFAGEIEALGEKVSSLKVGDKVFGFDNQALKSHAEYLTISEDKAVTIPIDTSYEQAAASMEGAHYAYNFINKVNLKSGQKVLVNGATGAIGSAAVQLLKYFGANVTAVCDGANIELVKSLGADRVIDYTSEDFTNDDFTGDDERYNFVFDTVGKSSFFKCRQLLERGGVYISSDLGYMYQNIFLPIITPLIKPIIGNRKTASPIPTDIRGSLLLIKRLIEEGKFKAVLDRKFSLEQIVEAYRYVEKGKKIGNVVITMKHNDKS